MCFESQVKKYHLRTRPLLRPLCKPLLSNYIAAPLATQGESLWLASHAPPPLSFQGCQLGPQKGPKPLGLGAQACKVVVLWSQWAWA